MCEQKSVKLEGKSAGTSVSTEIYCSRRTVHRVPRARPWASVRWRWAGHRSSAPSTDPRNPSAADSRHHTCAYSTSTLTCPNRHHSKRGELAPLLIFDREDPNIRRIRRNTSPKSQHSPSETRHQETRIERDSCSPLRLQPQGNEVFSFNVVSATLTHSLTSHAHLLPFRVAEDEGNNVPPPLPPPPILPLCGWPASQIFSARTKWDLIGRSELERNS